MFRRPRALCASLLLACLASTLLLAETVVANPEGAAAIPAEGESLIDTLKRWIEIVRSEAEARPFILFLSIAVLPAIGFPVSVLYLAAGVHGVLLGFVIALAGTAGNMALCWALAAYPMHGLLMRLLEGRGYKVPTFTRSNQIRLCFIIRLVPGTPFAIQNYLLGLARMPFHIYLAISVAVYGFWVFCFVLLSDAIFEGNFMNAAMAVSALVAGILLARMIASHRAARRKGEASSASTGE